MLRLILICLLTGNAVLDAQLARYPKVELTDVAAAIYVTGWEVEKEIVIRPLALPHGLRGGIPETGAMTAAAREALKPLVTDFFSKVFPVSIDGNTVDFVPDEVRFIEPDPGKLIEISGTEPVPVEDFMIMMKSSAPLPSLDSPISFSWSFFPEGMRKIPVRIADTLGTRLIEVGPASGQVDAGVKLATNLRNAPQPPPAPVVTEGRMPWLFIAFAAPASFLLFLKRWKGAIPLAALAGITWAFTSRQPSAEPVSPGQAVEITDRILENVYHAFNISDESAQYDQLNAVLAGPVLESTFLEVRRTTNQRSEDGSRVRVRNVNVLRASPRGATDELGFTTACRWETAGKIGHWGHFHNRKNLYSADISLAVIDGRWKATELNLNSRERE